MKTLLFSFENDATRDQFLTAIRNAADIMVKASKPDISEGGGLIQSTLNTTVLDPPIKEDHERIVAIFITGQKMYEGQLSEMNKVFEQELASHTGSVVMKELRGGEWTEIRARRKQG